MTDVDDDNSTSRDPALTGRYSSPYVQLVLARLREFIREPAAVFWVYGFPLMMMIGLGVAFREQPVEVTRVAIQSGENSSETLSVLSGSETIEAEIVDEKEARKRLRLGEADLVVASLPNDNSLKTGSYDYYFDATRPGSSIARNTVDDLLQRAAGREDQFTATEHQVTEPGGRYIDFLVPGLLGMGIMGGGLFGLGYAIVDMRIRKVLKRLMVTPMRRSQFLAAVMTSRFVFTIPEILFLLVVSWLLFGVVVHGNLLSVIFLIVLGTVQFAGIGLLVASRAKTLETVSGLINLAMIPMWMASGVFFSYERFPEFLHPVIRLMPLTPLVAALRAVILEGASLGSQIFEIAVMLVWTVVTFLLALVWFRWNE